MLCFLMAGLGANDALRGIFAPVFQERYDLNGSQLSLIVTISYVGNLLFLSIGGKLLDLFPQKECGCGGNGCLGGSSCPKSGVRQLYMDSGIHVFALGSIHPLNTTVNILTPAVFAGYAGLMVNVLFLSRGSVPAEASFCWEDTPSTMQDGNGLTLPFGSGLSGNCPVFLLKIPKQGEEKEQEKEILKKSRIQRYSGFLLP